MPRDPPVTRTTLPSTENKSVTERLATTPILPGAINRCHDDDTVGARDRPVVARLVRARPAPRSVRVAAAPRSRPLARGGRRHRVLGGHALSRREDGWP